MRKKIDNFLEKGLSILLLIMVINVLWQVISRYIFNKPSIFTDELARYLLIWIGLIGAAYGSGKKAHVSIDLLKQNLSKQYKKTHNIFVNIIVFLFAFLALIIGGTRLVIISFQLEQTSSAMHIPIAYVYLALPISGLLICFYAISDIINNLKSCSSSTL